MIAEPLERPSPTLPQLLAYTSFSLTAGLVFGSMGLIVLPAEVLVMWPETQAATLGVLLALTGISQLIAPAVGYLSDRCTHPLGRRRPYLLAGGAVSLLGLLGMRVARDGALPKSYAGSLLVCMLGMNCSYAGFTGLLPDLVPECMMGKASGLMAVLNAVGAALSFYLLGFTGIDVRYSYSLYGAAVIATIGVTAVFANEAPLLKASPVVGSEILRSFYVSMATHGGFAIVFWIRCTYYMGISVLSFMILFLRDVILPISGDDPIFGNGVEPSRWPTYYTSMIALIGQLGAVSIAVPIGRLSDRDGRKPYIYLACGMMVLVYLIFAFSPPLSVILAIAFMYGMGNGSFLTVDYALAVDTLPDKANAAQDLGLWGVAAFIGSSFGPLILGPLLHVIGILSLGGTLDDVFGKTIAAPNNGNSTDHELQYGPAGYRAILVMGIVFVSITAHMLKFVDKR
ncbi:hypothetical protein AB1Y20_000679 [Prymnesium parvum]|uniref:Major facilitator superfamily (MFS) profile domain-containing protein n=1 Tax=Prymnesium parvum TaxID=97485 RepID=A0AB34K5H3_PRYPA